MIITDKDRKRKYKRFKKNKDKTCYINSEPLDELEEAFIKAYNEKDIEKRYEFIYDYMTSYLDNLSNNLCEFKNNRCIANRKNKTCHKDNGCCYFYKEGLCKFLKNKKCLNPNMTCKIFMCEYIEKNKLKFKSIPKNYLLFDFFFNKKQKNILQRSFRVCKKDLIKMLLNNK